MRSRSLDLNQMKILEIFLENLYFRVHIYEIDLLLTRLLLTKLLLSSILQLILFKIASKSTYLGWFSVLLMKLGICRDYAQTDAQHEYYIFAKIYPRTLSHDRFNC